MEIGRTTTVTATPKPEATMPASAEALAEHHMGVLRRVHDRATQIMRATALGGDITMSALYREEVDALDAMFAALRADPTAGDREAGVQDCLAAIRAEMPETLNTGNLVHDVRTLRCAHDSVKDVRDRWGRALKLLLPFVDFAAGEGLMFTGDDDAPPMDAADLCVAFAAEMRFELGDAGYMAMLRAGQDAIRTLAAAQVGTPDPSPLHPHAEGNGHG